MLWLMILILSFVILQIFAQDGFMTVSSLSEIRDWMKEDNKEVIIAE